MTLQSSLQLNSIFFCFNRIALAMVLAFGLSGCVAAFAGVGAAAVTAGTTEKGLGTSVSDGIIKTKIRERFLQTDVGLLGDVTVTVNQGAVLLTGNVDMPEDKPLATQLAWEVRSVTEVINELEIKDESSLTDIAKDIAAAAQLRARLIGDANISSINFSIDVVNGTVFVSGLAASQEEVNAVVDHARSLRFATNVKNYIRINDDTRE